MKFTLPLKLGKLWIVLDKGQGLHSNTLLHSHLWAEHYHNGSLFEKHDLGSGVVTNVGVNLLASDITNATATLKLANYHDSGTGVTAPTISDTVMQTPTGNVRVAGTQSSSANVYQTQASLAYGTSYSITEWGLFTDPSTGTMWDHRTFTAIPVVSGDTILFIYQLTIASGG